MYSHEHQIDEMAPSSLQIQAEKEAPEQDIVIQAAAPAEDPVAKLKQMKELLDAGIISQEEFDAAKAKYLGV